MPIGLNVKFFSVRKIKKSLPELVGFNPLHVLDGGESLMTSDSLETVSCLMIVDR